MPQGHNTPSLYEMLIGNFTGGLALNQVSEENQVILSVLDNMQRILNCRAGTLAHLPDYGLPDMTKILQGMPGQPMS
jgi:type VI secretion system protein